MTSSKKSTKKAAKKADAGADVAAKSSSVSFPEVIKIPEANGSPAGKIKDL